MGFIAITVAVLLGLILIDSKVYKNFISAKVTSEIRKTGLPIFVDAPELFLFGIKAPELTANFRISPFAILSIKLSDVNFRPVFLDLLGGKLVGYFTATAYNGDLSGRLDKESESEDVKVSLNLQHADLSKHPQLAALGLESGKLTVIFKNLILKKDNFLPDFKTLSLTFEDGSIATNFLSNLDLPLELPHIKDLTVTLTSSLKEGALEITSLQLRSSVLIISNASGNLELKNGQSLSFNADVELADVIAKKFTPTLMIAALQASHHTVHSNLTDKSKKFSVKISGFPRRLKIELTDKAIAKVPLIIKSKKNLRTSKQLLKKIGNDNET